MSDETTELEQCKYKPPYDARPMRMLRHHIECDCHASRRSVLRTIEDLFAIELEKRDEQIAKLCDENKKLKQFLRDYHNATGDMLIEYDYLLACGFDQRIRELGIEVK